MFSPPPSPSKPAHTELPSGSRGSDSTYLSPPTCPMPSSKGKEVAQIHVSQSDVELVKRRTGRRHRFAVIAVPLLLIAFTLCSTYVLRTPASRQLAWPTWFDSPSYVARLQRRKQGPETIPSPTVKLQLRAPSSTTSPSSTSSSRRVSSQPIPTVPDTPPTLPTPFPQTFDSGITLNFSSTSCSNFFSNMTSSAPFRTCRPFSLLLQSSDAFFNAQSNLTLMNNVIWGTCNTNTAYTQCKANMGWFSGAIQTQCAQELEQRHTLALKTTIALKAFEVMHDIGCLQDPASNTYCYLNAVRADTPSDLYYYSLPLGVNLPKSIQPTCSACSKSIMSIFSAALKNPTNAGRLGGSDIRGLATTYENAAEVCRANCGAEFAQVNVVSGALSVRDGRLWGWMVFVGSLTVWILL